MVLSIIGGILVLMGPFFFWYMDLGMFGCYFSGIQNFSYPELQYAWLIPITGLLAISLGIVGYASQNKFAGGLIALLGFVAGLTTILIPLHFAIATDSSFMEELFVTDELGSMEIYIGGFLAMFGSLLAVIGGIILARKVKPAPPPTRRRIHR